MSRVFRLFGVLSAVASLPAMLLLAHQVSKVYSGPSADRKVASGDLFDGMNPEQAERFRQSRKEILGMVKASEGGVAGGGGNEKEGDFVSLARILYQHLERAEPRSSESLGFPLVEFKNAINRIEVHCAVDPSVLMLMRELKKTAFFTVKPMRIHLDCENYERFKETGDLGPITVFHEYMRAIGRDTSAYEASSKLLLVFYDVAATKNRLTFRPNESAVPDNKACSTQEQTETLAKMEPCLKKMESEGIPYYLERDLRFFKCLSRAYQTEKVDPAKKLFWEDIYFLTEGYFKYDLSAQSGNQSQRCGLAGTLSKYVLLGKPR